MSQPVTFKARLKHYAMEAEDWTAENPLLLQSERGYELPSEDYPKVRRRSRCTPTTQSGPRPCPQVSAVPQENPVTPIVLPRTELQ